ncbi:MAG: translesion error-prone DNA polymerase V autoproteolytic subunit [Candidatus Cloacimonetes bacterium]|nr:translesion error-prone DNA polymerase V autoproteolytic subunit [Candidatus Cloacimonadota bacterium]
MNKKENNIRPLKKGKNIAQILSYEEGIELELPMYKSEIKAGFPSPASDYIESTLDLNKHLVKHPAATFFVRVEGDSMIDAAIHSGDILIVDRAIQPEKQKIVIAAVNGELTVKRIWHQNDKLYLQSSNVHFEPIEITADMDFHVWGVVTYVIHKPI